MSEISKIKTQIGDADVTDSELTATIEKLDLNSRISVLESKILEQQD